MSRPAMPRLSPRTLARAQQESRRCAALARVVQLLEQGRRTAREIADDLGVHASTAHAYLMYMARELHTVRRSSITRGNGVLWELGADPALVAASNAPDAGGLPRRLIVPAVQVGQHRDPLTAALFGPAQQLETISRASAPSRPAGGAT